jgi:predicted ATP-dependent endonuclease of OLD family
MALGKKESMSEILRLLSERREMLEQLPYSSARIRKDKKISARIRELVEHIFAEQSAASEHKVA